MTKAINVLTDEEYSFDENTTPEWAVAYAYCAENNLLSWLFGMAQGLKAVEAYKAIGVRVGRRTVGCGDWACLIK